MILLSVAFVAVIVSLKPPPVFCVCSLWCSLIVTLVVIIAICYVEVDVLLQAL